MFASLRARLLFSYIMVMGVTLCIVSTALLFILLSSPLPTRQMYERLESIGRAALPSLRGNPSNSDARLKAIAESTSARILLASQDHRVFFDSDGAIQPGRTLDVRSTQPEANDITRGTYRVGQDQVWLFVALKLPNARNDADRLIIAAPRPPGPLLSFFGENMLRPLLQAAVIGLILAIILAFLISSSVAGPLKRTAVAARAIADGDYSKKSPLEGPVEVRELGRAFNEMAQKVQRSQQTQRDFLANVSHELKTPLTSIQGYAQAILDGATVQPSYAARVIYDEAARMHRLVEDLLDLARIESGQSPFQREHIRLAQLLQSVMENLALRASKQGVTLLHSLTSVPPITGDNDRLAQVLTNLIDNAITHTPSGGQVRVSAAHIDSGVQVIVSDTGKGIPPEELSRIFERFYQVDKSRMRSDKRGTGLGLTISKEIIEANGGKIYAERGKEGGTTFNIWLPLPRASDETVPRVKN